MTPDNPFKWRHFESQIILLCVRWYLRYCLSYRDLEEMILGKLQNEVPKPTFEIWLKDTLLLNVAGHTARVMVPSTFAGEWLERRMYQSITRALGDVLHQEVGVEFVATQPAS